MRALVALAASGCVSAPAAPEARSSTAPHVAAPEHAGFAQGFALLSSVAQGVRFSLPEAARWSIRDGSGGLIATHAATRSRLVVRAFRDASPAHRESCEAQARAADGTIPRLGAERIESRRLLLARDYALALDVAIADESGVNGEHTLRGDALAFGGDGRRCLAVLFSTHASGTRAESAVAERLGVIVESTFARMRLRSIDERVRVPRP